EVVRLSTRAARLRAPVTWNIASPPNGGVITAKPVPGNCRRRPEAGLRQALLSLSVLSMGFPGAYDLFRARTNGVTLGFEGARRRRRLGVMANDLLVSYVPRLLADWQREAPGEAARTIEGTLVFVDISGFTKLSERLAR